MGKETWEGQTL